MTPISISIGFVTAMLVLVAGLVQRRRAFPVPERKATLRYGRGRGGSGDSGRRLRRPGSSLAGVIGMSALSAVPVLRDRAWSHQGHVAETAGGVVLVLPIAIADLRIAAIAVAFAGARPWLRLKRERAEHQRRLGRELPEVVDLLSVAVAGGLTVPLALDAVGQRLGGAVAATFRSCLVAAGQGQRLADVLETVPGQLGDSVRPLVRALVSAERYGTPIAGPLVQVAADLRLERRRSAEITARRLPVKLLFPLVVCVLPAFVLLTVIPILVASLESLRP